MKKIVLLFIFLVSYQSVASNYCAAIRGNGELIMTHWSALARITENNGLPQKVAGGSSAVITLLFLDSLVRANYTSTGTDKKLENALLLKSMMPHLDYLYTESAKIPKSMSSVSEVLGMDREGFINKVKFSLKASKTAAEVVSNLGDYVKLINPELIVGLTKDFDFYKNEISEGLKTFGAFDSKEEKLFFREGIVDFKYLAIILGRVADFYAGFGGEKVNNKLKKFLKACKEDAYGKTWMSLVKKRPECGKLLSDAFNEYYIGKNKDRDFPNKMVFEKIGSGLKSFPTTATITSSAANRYLSQLQFYKENKGKIQKPFSVKFEKEVRYSYWGDNKNLNVIKKNILTNYPNDLKSQKFHPIYEGTWFEALSTSPAEPGLSNLVRVPNGKNIDKEKVLSEKSKFILKKNLSWIVESDLSKSIIPFRGGMFSAGGWSDLHPVLVLKASGCNEVVYVTRQDGETIFGQQTFLRLTGEISKIKFWKEIGKKNREGYKNLSTSEKRTNWNKLYNLGNPNSSYNKSVREADVVYCTDWNEFFIFKGDTNKSIIDAYNAPIFVKNEKLKEGYKFGGDPAGKSKDDFPGCIAK